MPSLNTKLASAPNTQTNYVLKATSSTTIGNSLIQDDGTNVAIGTTPATYKLNVNGTLGVTGAATLSSSVTANGVMSLSDDGTYGSNYKTLGFTGNTNGNHRIFAGVTDGMFICSKTGEGIFFRVNGGTTNNLTISSAGNVGIGVTPNTWNSVYKTLQIGASMSLLQDGSSVSSYWGGNLYVGADGNYKYTINGAAGLFGIEGGSLVYYGVASGTAGTNASLVERFNVSTTGPFRIYTPSGTSETLRLICADTIGDGYISYYRTSGVRKAYIGYGASNDDPFSIMQEENANIIIGTNGSERMRILAGGQIFINTTTDPSAGARFVVANGFQQEGICVRMVSTGAYSPIAVRDTTGAELFNIRENGAMDNPYAYNTATGSAANVHVTAIGRFLRSTSSLKYKTDVRNYDKGLAEVMQMRPVYYKGKTDGDTQFAGLIAEEIHELGLTEFVQYAEDGTPDALAYQNMVALLVKAIQQQQQQINQLINK